MTGDAVPREPLIELARMRGHRPGAVLGELREAQRRTGRLGGEELRDVAERVGLPVAAVAGTASFFADLALARRGTRHVRVCQATACFAATAGTHLREAEQALGIALGGCSPDGMTSLQPVHCLGYCYASPAALDIDTPATGADLAGQLAGQMPARDPAIPFASSLAEPVVLAGLQGCEPAWPVWSQIRSSDNGPERVLAAMHRSGLRGRGGAEFPVARKWEAVRATAVPGSRYVVANGDEGDPGSYADRLLMESDPDRILAGLVLAALACGADEGVVYVRSEYLRAAGRLRAAVHRAREAGHLGRDRDGRGIDVHIVEGAGSYVAGEETALIHAAEGLRGTARSRPPYPTSQGLFGCPTAVNNVETLAAVPWIVAHGGDAYARLGMPPETGTKLVCLNERFARPGVYEIELGTPLRHVVEVLGGGLRDGARLRALQVGGPLGGFLGPDDLDLPLLDAALSAAGGALGHASLVALDDRLPGIEVLRHVWRFAAAESCGACSPCRVGARRGLEMAVSERLDGQDRLLDVMATTSMCAFGRGVPRAVRTLLRIYRDELTGASDATDR